MMQTIAAAFGGGQVSGNNYGSNDETVVIYGEEDIKSSPIGLGYESV